MICICVSLKDYFFALTNNGLVSGSCEQLSQYTNYTYTAAAVDTALWFVILHTVSMEQIMYAEWRIIHGKVRIACKVFLVCKMYIHIHL